jgi:hypothetical protein
LHVNLLAVKPRNENASRFFIFGGRQVYSPVNKTPVLALFRQSLS